MKRARRIDVAKAAGVSQSTVSYVMRNTPGVKIREETRRKVREAAKELGYEPHFSASSLARGKTGVVGLLLHSQQMQFMQFFSNMVEGIIQGALDSPNFFMYLGLDQKEKYERCFSRHYLDGAIVIQAKDQATHIENIRKYGKPIVTVDYLSKSGIPGVSMNYEHAVDVAYTILSSRERKKIAFVVSDRGLQPNRRHIRRHNELKRIYSDSVQFIHIDYEAFIAKGNTIADIAELDDWDGFVVDGVPRGMAVVDRYRAQGKALGRDFDLVTFCTNETEVHSAVPEEVFILVANGREMGKQAWRIMERLLAGEEVTQQEVLLPFVEARSWKNEI